MKIIQEAEKMQRQAIRWRMAGEKIAFVPTMGALHEGHASLLRQARHMGNRVVLSIYVNPTQFGKNEDFKKYPRQLKQDLALAKKEKVDAVFAPTSLYFKDDSTFVEETFYSKGRCGAIREGHFRGVTTVVCKLFHIVQPHVAIFGQKDAQQCDVIEQMIRDLYFPIQMVRAPIIRDSNGLALSSRNKYLTSEEYEIAIHLPRILKLASKRTGLSPRQITQLIQKELQKVNGLSVEYVEYVRGGISVAVRVGETRLIDYISIK